MPRLEPVIKTVLFAIAMLFLLSYFDLSFRHLLCRYRCYLLSASFFVRSVRDTRGWLVVMRQTSIGQLNSGSDKCGAIQMDSLTAAARPLAPGDPLGNEPGRLARRRPCRSQKGSVNNF
jgi:hypothetical protein